MWWGTGVENEPGAGRAVTRDDQRRRENPLAFDEQGGKQRGNGKGIYPKGARLSLWRVVEFEGWVRAAK